MATQLNPGADATLVQAATNAAMANVPKDYSKAFTAMAQGQILGLAGIQAAVTPLVKDMFAEIPAEFQKLVKTTMKQIEGNIRHKILGKDEYDHEIAQEVEFDETQQTFYDSELINMQISKDDGKFIAINKGDIDSVKALQRQLQDMYGSDVIDFYKNGVLQTGEDAIDGDFGGATSKAYQQFKKDYKELSETQPFYRSESKRLGKQIGEHIEGDRTSGYSSSYFQRAVKTGFDAESTEWSGAGDGKTYDLTNTNQYNAALKAAKYWDDINKATATKTLDKYKSLIPQTIIPGEKNNFGYDYSYTDDNGNPVHVDFKFDDDHVKGIKERQIAANKLKGDKKKDAINELNEIFETTRQGEKNLTKKQIEIGMLIRDGNINPEAMGGMNISFLTAIARRGARDEDGSRIMKGFTSDGNPILMWVDKYNKPITNPKDGKAFTATAEDLELKYIVRKDAELEADISTLTRENQIARGKSGADDSPQEFINYFTKLIDSENKFQDATSTTQLDMDGTYVENIWGIGKDMKGALVGKNTKFQTAIFSALMKQSGMFDKSGPKGKPDNKITTHDFMTPENYIAAANYLTNYNPTAVNAFANFMQPSAAGYYEEGKKTRKIDKKDKGIKLNNGVTLEGYNSWDAWRHAGVVLDLIQKIQSPGSIENIEGWDNYVYTPLPNGKWQSSQEDTPERSSTWMYDRFQVPMNARPSGNNFTTIKMNANGQLSPNQRKNLVKGTNYKILHNDGKQKGVYLWNGTKLIPQ